jgi:hypothetical protein
MTTKSTTFKRIALGLVAALSFGVLGSGASNALLANSTVLTLSASSGSAAPGETATVTATVEFTTDAASESVVLTVDGNSGTAADVTENFYGSTTDSANVASAASTGWQVGVTNGGSAGGSAGIVSVATANRAVKALTTFAFVVAPGAVAPAQYTYTISVTNGSGGALLAAKSFVLNVTARDLTATAAKSLLWINQALWTTSPIEADSALVVSSGKVLTGAQTYAAVGYLGADHRNASDTNVVGGASYPVTGSLVVTITGPGGLVLGSSSGSCTSPTKSVTLTNASDSAIVCSDGNPGVSTITGYIGSTALTQAAKSITFYGPAATLTPTANTITRNSGYLSSDAADSVTVGTAIVTFTAKDSAGYTIAGSGAGTAAAAFGQNVRGTMYCISSDTAVVGASLTGPGTNVYIEPTWSSTNSNWACNMVVRKAGTATITIGDSLTVASSTVKSDAVTINTETKTGYTGTITFDKASYNVGDLAVITVTSKAKTTGNNVGQAAAAGSASNPFTGIEQNRAFSGVKGTMGFGTGGTGTSWDLTASTFVNGVETYVVYMPNTAGKVTLTGFTSYDSTTSNTAVNVSVDVVDPLAKDVAAAQAATVAAAAAAQAAAVAAADAATDAALEAIDAANAATDAANLAAEAADAATVAAEEARDAADAATAAVEALATEVATMMAALKAQLTTLAATVAKIAKKVKA